MTFTDQGDRTPAFVYDTDFVGEQSAAARARLPGAARERPGHGVPRRRAAARDAALRRRRPVRRRRRRRAQPDRGHDRRPARAQRALHGGGRSGSRWRSRSGSALSSTLTRRLGRLQRVRAADHRRGPGGARPDRPRPRRGRRPGARDRPHAGGAQTPGGGAPLVRLDRLARAAHAADDAPGHDGAARGGPARRRRPRRRPGAGRKRPPRAAAARRAGERAAGPRRGSTRPSSCARSRSS